MPMQDSVFVELLKPIRRRSFQQIVDRHDADAYDKSFKSWQHLVALLFAQLSGITSLRGLVAAFNAERNGHYHLGVVGRLARSTLAEANVRRPLAVFTEFFAHLSGELDRVTRRDGAELLRLLDSTPIPLSKFHDFARSNGRINGLKMHVAYDKGGDRPYRVEVTPANVNDVTIGKKTPIETGATYVFDKGYYDFAWWAGIHAAGALFVTRPKRNSNFVGVADRPLANARGDGFTVLEDSEVKLASKGDSKLPMRLRRVKIARDRPGNAKPDVITVITNDMRREAVEIAALYKARWAIELLFRWIKQHLHIRKFLGKNENAIKLQLLAAMIAFVLLRIAAHRHSIVLEPLRFAELVERFLFSRRSIGAIEDPPQKCLVPSRWASAHQLRFKYA